MRGTLWQLPGIASGWPACGATLGGTHFSHDNQITPENVSQLEVAWHHRSGDMREARYRQRQVNSD